MVDPAVSPSIDPQFDILPQGGCIMAFHGLTVDKKGTIMPCCQYGAGDAPSLIPWQQSDRYHQIVRQNMLDDMIKNQPHKACAKCYAEESLGGHSLRLHANKSYGDRYQMRADAPIYHLEIRAGNVCNLKCMMCWPGASSAIAAERYHHRDRFTAIGLQVEDPAPTQAWWQDPHFKSWFTRVVTDVQHLHFTGGEPFLIPDIVDLISVAVALSPDIEIGFNTNLTLLTADLMHSLRSVKRLSLAVSLEGVGAANDYIRFPSTWADIHDNLQICRREFPHAQITCNHTLQHASVYGLPALIMYCDENDLSINFNLVQGNPNLSWQSVPPPDLERFRYWIERNDMQPHYKDFLQKHCATINFDRAKYHGFRQYVELLDAIRGTSWDDTFHPSVLA